MAPPPPPPKPTAPQSPLPTPAASAAKEARFHRALTQPNACMPLRAAAADTVQRRVRTMPAAGASAAAARATARALVARVRVAQRALHTPALYAVLPPAGALIGELRGDAALMADAEQLAASASARGDHVMAQALRACALMLAVHVGARIECFGAHYDAVRARMVDVRLSPPECAAAVHAFLARVYGEANDERATAALAAVLIVRHVAITDGDRNMPTLRAMQPELVATLFALDHDDARTCSVLHGLCVTGRRDHPTLTGLIGLRARKRTQTHTLTQMCLSAVARRPATCTCATFFAARR